jgi:hypothetical protein
MWPFLNDCGLCVDQKLYDMQLSLAFLSYTMFIFYSQPMSGKSKGLITAYLIGESYATAGVGSHSDSGIISTTAIEFEPNAEFVSDIALREAVKSVQEPFSSSVEAATSSLTEPSSDNDSSALSPVDAIEEGSSAGSTVQQVEDSATVTLVEGCIGEPPIARPRTYSIRYLLDIDEHPLAEGVYSNCKVCLSASPCHFMCLWMTINGPLRRSHFFLFP